MSEKTSFLTKLKTKISFKNKRDTPDELFYRKMVYRFPESCVYKDGILKLI